MHSPEGPAESACESGMSPAAAAGLAGGTAPVAASLSAAGAAAGAADALTDTGVEAAAELEADPGDLFLGVAAANRSESSSLSGSAWSKTEFSDGDMLMADGLMCGDLQQAIDGLLSFSTPSIGFTLLKMSCVMRTCFIIGAEMVCNMHMREGRQQGHSQHGYTKHGLHAKWVWREHRSMHAPTWLVQLSWQLAAVCIPGNSSRCQCQTCIPYLAKTCSQGQSY